MDRNAFDILVISDGPLTHCLHDALASEDHPFTLKRVERLDDTITELNESSFDIVLIERPNVSPEVIDFIELIRRNAPGSPLILVSERHDEAVEEAALRSGIQEYLSWERMQPSALWGAIRRATARARASAPGAGYRCPVVHMNCPLPDVATRNREESLTAGQNRVLQQIAEGAPLAKILDLVARIVEEQASDILCALLTLNPDEKTLSFRAAPSLPDWYRAARATVPVGPRHAACGAAAFHRKAVFSRDIANDPIWTDYREPALSLGLRACWSVPIFSTDRDVLGTFALFSREIGEPSSCHLRLIEVATHLAAIAISRNRAETALAHERDLLHTLMDSIPDSIYFKDVKHRFTRINRAQAQVLGLREPDEAVGRCDADFLPVGDASAAASDEDSIVSTGQPLIGKVEEIRLADGSPRWQLVSQVPILDAQRNVVGTVGLSRDITELRQAEEALKESQRSLTTLLSNLPGMAYRCANDEHWTLQFASDGCLELTGYSADQLIGNSLVSFAEVIHPDDREYVSSSTINAVESTLPYTLTYRIICASGEVKWVWEHGRAVYHSTGELAALEGFITDITERKRAEEAEEEQRTLAEALRDTAEALNRTTSFDDLLDRILINVGRVVPHDAGSIIMVRGEFAEVVRSRGFYQRGEEHVLGMRFRIGKGTTWELQDDGPLIIADTRNDPRWALREETNWIRSSIVAPLYIKGQFIGSLNLDSATPDYFTSKHAAHFQSFVHQAASALENARLLSETTRRANEFSALYDTASALATQPDLPALLQTIVERASGLLSVDRGAVFLYLFDPTRGDLEIVAGMGLPFKVGTRLKMGEGMAGRVALTRAPIIVEDYSSWEHRSGAYGDIPLTASVGVPILHRGELIGVLGMSEIGGQTYCFSDADIRLLSLFASQAASAVHNARLFEATQQRLERLAALRNIDNAINSSLDLNVTLDVLLRQVTEQLQVDSAAVLLLKPYSQSLEYIAERGFRSNAILHTRVRLGGAYAGRAALARQILSFDRLSEHEAPQAWGSMMANEGFVSYFAAPLIAKGEVKGILEIFNRTRLCPDPEWHDFLETLAGQAAIALDNAALLGDLKKSNLELALAYDTTIEGWSHALDLRDKETVGHSMRVTEMTLELATILGVSDEELVHIRRGALLHDIGKMGVPDNILLKPGPLDDEEWEIMRRHPTYAFELLSPITFLRPALDIPFSHHEKWDGSGYPRGLRGEEIPLAARIFAVVDVWDALRADRPYRAGWPEEKVLTHILEQSGKHFDPQVVRAFMQLAARPQAYALP